jgi:hypothetical protein
MILTNSSKRKQLSVIRGHLCLWYLVPNNADNAVQCNNSKSLPHLILFYRIDILPFRQVGSGCFVILEFADEVDNDVVLLNSQVVEVFADRHCEPFLVLPGLLAPEHGW